MIFNLYSIKDVVADEFGPVFQSVNDGVAVRSAVNVLKSAENPADYELYRIGAFNSDTGALAPEHAERINFILSPDRKIAVLEGGNE